MPTPIKKKHFSYKQTTGIPMGTACSLTVACVYLSYFELRYQLILTTTLFCRYIDDVFQSKIKGQSFPFEEIYPGLTLNTETSKSVNFLDLIISITPTNTIHKNLFVSALIILTSWSIPPNSIIIWQKEDSYQNRFNTQSDIMDP